MSVFLPNLAWRQSLGLLTTVAALRAHGGEVRIVGGAVRDAMLGLPVSDIDLATTLLPHQTTQALETAQIKAIPTGIDHGTVTALSHGQTLEITTLRRDVATDGRRATVAYSTEWRDDAARRDFTINALFADPESGEIFDYFDGLDDLNRRHIRFIGDASQRIAEDHLRILRYFRFFARFGEGRPDHEAIYACHQAANSLLALSRERICDELSKLLASPKPTASIALMQEHEIFASFLPEVRPDAANRLDQLIQREQRVTAEINWGRRLNAILPPDLDVAEKVGSRLKMANKHRKDLCTRAGHQLKSDQPTYDARKLAYHHGIALAQDICLLSGDDANWEQGYRTLLGWDIPQFPISGGDLIARGLTAGPDVAPCLRKAETRWIEEGFPGKGRVAEIADQLVGEILLTKKL
jgi:poly(A) polymerase